MDSAPLPAPAPLVAFGIAGLSVVLLVVWPLLVWRATRDGSDGRSLTIRTAIAFAGFALFTLGLASSGVLARVGGFPPPFAMVPALAVIGTVVFVRSRAGQAMVDSAPFSALVGLQAFRLPLELVMHHAAAVRLMPAQMTFGATDGSVGLNYDILTGISALLLGLVLAWREVPRAIVLAWNVLGTVLLAIIVGVAIASIPTFAAFGHAPENLNTWVCFPPYVLLVSVLVASALLGHVIVFRKLARGA